MRMQPITLTLGQSQWRVRPLTLHQVEQIEPLILDGPQAGSGSIATAIHIVAIALQRDHAEAAAGLRDIEASVHEISAAMSQILQIGGFIAAPAAELPPGKPIADAD